jgi:hypothetical protein
VRDADTKRPISAGAVIPFTEAEPEHVFTVPVGGKYFVSSDPIDLGGGTNVLLRSIGEREGGLDIDVTSNQAGADFAVDLCLVEMTAIVERQNPSGRVIDSQPDAEEVEAYLSQTVTNALPMPKPRFTRWQRGACVQRPRRAHDLDWHCSMAAKFHQGRREGRPHI